MPSATSPVDARRRVRGGQPAEDPRRRPGDQRQDRRARRDRPSGLLRAPRGRGPGRPRRPAARPRRRAARPSAILYEGLGIADARGAAAGRRGGRLRDRQGPLRESRGADPRGHRALETRRDRLLLGEAEEIIDGLVARARGHARGTAVEPAGSLPAATGDDRRPRPARRDRPTRRPSSRGSRAGRRRAGPRRRRPQGRGHPAARPAGGPDAHAARRGRHLPGPLHRLEGPQHPRCGGSPATGAGACPRRASCGSTRTGRPLEGDAAELRTFPTEADAYAFLDLPFIEPELREDRGEIEAARAGRLPALITRADLRGDLHSHSDWSDGVHPIELMAEAARRRGHAYQVLTDHTRSWPSPRA